MASLPTVHVTDVVGRFGAPPNHRLFELRIGWRDDGTQAWPCNSYNQRVPSYGLLEEGQTVALQVEKGERLVVELICEGMHLGEIDLMGTNRADWS